MLLVFATKVAGGMSILYFLSRRLLPSSFRDLETEKMKQKWSMHSQVSLGSTSAWAEPLATTRIGITPTIS